MKKFGRKGKWIAGCTGGAVALLVLGAAIGSYVIQRTTGPGPLPSEDLEDVVAQIRSENLAPGQVHRFRLNDGLSPKSLRALEDNEPFQRGKGRGLVWAEVTAEGGLRVAIETRDLGHAGEWGFLYTDAPVTTADIVELGREWHLERPISTHWWFIHYDLG